MYGAVKNKNNTLTIENTRLYNNFQTGYGIFDYWPSNSAPV